VAVTDGVWLITGAQTSGKSTVAELLTRRFERGVHVRGGQFYRWAVAGWVHFDDRERPEEARRLLDLRYRLSALVADEYASAGFATIVQDNIYGNDVVRWLESVTARPRHLVVLRPRVDVIAARDEQRRRSTGKVAYRGGFTVAKNDADLATTPRQLGLWLDTSDQALEQTVMEVLTRRREAQIP
jgi:adenylylsulfate kinase-like enzyme